MLQILSYLEKVFHPGETGELEILWDAQGIYVVYDGTLSFADHYSYNVRKGMWENDTNEDTCEYGSDNWAREVGLL